MQQVVVSPFRADNSNHGDRQLVTELPKILKKKYPTNVSIRIISTHRGTCSLMPGSMHLCWKRPESQIGKLMINCNPQEVKLINCRKQLGMRLAICAVYLHGNIMA